MTKTFDVLISELIGKTIRVEAETQEAAEKLILSGQWTDADVIKDDCVEWSIADTKEVTE